MKLTNIITATTALLATAAQAAPVEDPAALAVDEGKIIDIDIPWDKVLRTFTSMVACEVLIPVMEIKYFPAAIVCLPIPGGAAMIIIKPTWG